jgi:hypothetical protein
VDAIPLPKAVREALGTIRDGIVNAASALWHLLFEVVEMILRTLTWSLLRMLLRYIRRRVVNRILDYLSAQAGRERDPQRPLGSHPSVSPLTAFTEGEINKTQYSHLQP